MVTAILIAAVVVGGVGLLLGLFLGVANEKLKVEIDEKEEQVRSLLPGNNCGGCGYAGCDALAKAIAAGEADTGACPVGGSDVAAQIAAIMGQEAGESVRKTAFVKCAGTCEKTKENYRYYGVEDCEMMEFVPAGGAKACQFGCLGFGTCVKVCPFDAIHVKDGVAVVDKQKCKACGKCVARCPRHLIELVPCKNSAHVVCASKDKGKQVMQACEVGCIGCRKCQKICPAGAVQIADNLAYIDGEKCTGCGTCVEVCPRGIITGVTKKEA